MENKEISRAHIFFSGRVQGVFFRRTCTIKAKMAKIKGWVKNLKDGRVEAVFEGEKEKIKNLIKNIGKGNFLIRVDYFEIEWQENGGEFNDFKIVH